MKKFSWDNPLPNEWQVKWESFFDDIQELMTVWFPRCLQLANSLDSLDLHVFADASILAYGAVTDNNQRLELKAALTKNVVLWSDSITVLAWLRSESVIS